MNKTKLATQLREIYASIFGLATSMTEQVFNFAPDENRWTAGQQLQHLIISTKPFNKALRLPKAVLQEKFGLNNRPERQYEETVKRYQIQLKAGGTAPSNFEPEKLDFSQKEQIVETLQKELEQLTAALEMWSEEDLSKYVLPHPLLGMLSIRELFGFTIYHTKHHTEILQEEYLIRE
ncbi:MAG: DinB family protein [Bacteroidota bacterium]